VLKLAPFVSGLLLASIISVGYGAFVGSAVAVAQDFYHVTPEASGVLFMLTGVAFMVGSLSARFIVGRLGVERMLLAGCLLAVIGCVPLALPDELPLAGFWLVICLYLTGFGVVAPLGFAKALEPAGEAAGAASSLLGTITTLTNAAGAALAASGLLGGLYDTLRILLLGSALLCTAVQVTAMLRRRRATAEDVR
jgi:DHA1 family bicyclomycin/chloramphenicol resistance-like MFS transporter